MYQLNRKAIKGMIIAGSLVAVVPTIIKEQSSHNAQLNLPEEKQEENHEIYGPDLNQSISDVDLSGCIVYKKYTSFNLNGEWSEWIEEPTLYIGRRKNVNLEEYLENDTTKIKIELLGFIENDYKEKDFLVTQRTYHEETYEDATNSWRTIGEPVTTLNSRTLPERCMNRWKLDNIEYEKIAPVVSETELYQKYDLVIQDGEITYEPTFYYTTIENIPDSDYKFIYVGEYQKSEDLEMKGNTIHKTL